jgi:hypothetical protein
VSNFDQLNSDNDEQGDACDQDDDNDNDKDFQDNCPLKPNAEQANNDGDSLGDPCDLDDDNDGLPDGVEEGFDLNPLDPDSDGDGINDGDEMCEANVPCDKDRDGIIDALEADSDFDGDGILDKDEAGDSDTFTDPVDSDDDGMPDFKDLDSDGDQIPDETDKCLGEICKNGGSCATGADCASGNCAPVSGSDKGICCNTPCNGLCDVCSDQGQCGLQEVGYNPFANDSCVGETVVGVACNAIGELEAKESLNCPPFKCLADKGECTTSCASNGDCAEQLGYCGDDGLCHEKQAETFGCKTNDQCLAPAECLSGTCVIVGQPECAVDGFTLVNADKSTKDCTPFACAEADCLKACEDVADCASPYVCGLDKQCVPRPDADVTAEGACALTASSTTGRGLAAMFVLPLLVALRRRRRS